MTSKQRSCPYARRGSIFVEAAAAITLVLMAMGAAAQLIALDVRQRRELEQRHIAMCEAANILEHVYSLSWQDLTDRDEAWADISDFAKANLHEPQVRVSIQTTTDAIPTKRCHVAITWLDQSDQRVQPVQLTGWKFLAEGS